MELIRIPAKVAVQDAVIIGGYWLVMCGLDNVLPAMREWAAMPMLLGLWGVMFLLLFFSHAELFKWVRNAYAWSISTGIVTLSVLLPVAIASVHAPCPMVGGT